MHEMTERTREERAVNAHGKNMRNLECGEMQIHK
jgi:hypothetical protein